MVKHEHEETQKHEVAHPKVKTPEVQAEINRLKAMTGLTVEQKKANDLRVAQLRKTGVL
jgi:hypothetical protein